MGPRCSGCHRQSNQFLISRRQCGLASDGALTESSRVLRAQCTHHFSSSSMRSQWCLYFSAASACSCECFGGFWERTVLTAVPVRHRNRGLHRPMAGRSHQRADARISCRRLLQEPSTSIGRRSSIVSSTISLHRCRRQGGSAMSGRIAYTIQSLLGKAPLAAALYFRRLDIVAARPSRSAFLGSRRG